MPTHNPFHNRQPQAIAIAPGALAGWVNAIEALKDMWQVFRGYQ
jgi:hypothetical protein